VKLKVGEDCYTIVKADVSDINTVLKLLVHAAKWLQTKNTSQWDYYLTDLEGNTEEVRESIMEENTFLIYCEEQAIATITLEGTPNEWDRDIWQDEVEEQNVMYIHRIVVHRDYSGKRIGSNLLKWAEDKARVAGKKKVRFDCLHNNKNLNNYYKQYYSLKGIARIYGKHSKFEKIL
jgi:GNAT superfamily N-acetyltransferase